jgi:hypothetical protein
MKNFDERPREDEKLLEPTPKLTAVPNSNMSMDRQSLVSKRGMEDLRGRWTTIQASFVDEPRKAVEQADQLVESAIKQIEEGFRDQRSQLEKQWNAGTDASTEDLRLSLQRYRTFFDRLLSM